jgi:type IV secretion system protein VirB11
MVDLKQLPAIIRGVYAPLHPYVSRDDVKEVVLNKPYEVGIELRNGQWEWHHDDHLDEDFLVRMCTTFANDSGQEFSRKTPQLSFKLSGGHRVQAIMGEFVPHGIALSIRVHHPVQYELESWGLSKEDIRNIQMLVESHQTILISGATSTGKTSMLNAIIPLIDLNERIVTLEGITELRVPHRNWCALHYSENNSAIGGLSVKDLLNASMRLRPDRILMGEIRKENAYTFFHAATSGHEGGMATIHANSTEEALIKLAHYAVYAGDLDSNGVDLFSKDLKKYINAVIQIKRTKDSKLSARLEVFS